MFAVRNNAAAASAHFKFQVALKPLFGRGIFYEPLDVVKFHPFRAQQKNRELASKKQHGFSSALTRLAFLARCMGYLV